jgi:hypothetical protein
MQEHVSRFRDLMEAAQKAWVSETGITPVLIDTIMQTLMLISIHNMHLINSPAFISLLYRFYWKEKIRNCQINY